MKKERGGQNIKHKREGGTGKKKNEKIYIYQIQRGIVKSREDTVAL